MQPHEILIAMLDGDSEYAGHCKVSTPTFRMLLINYNCLEVQYAQAPKKADANCLFRAF